MIVPMMLLFLQLFIDGEHIGDGATVVEMNEAGDLEEMLEEYMVNLNLKSNCLGLNFKPYC